MKNNYLINLLLVIGFFTFCFGSIVVITSSFIGQLWIMFGLGILFGGVLITMLLDLNDSFGEVKEQ